MDIQFRVFKIENVSISAYDNGFQVGVSTTHEKKIGRRDCSPWAHDELTVSTRSVHGELTVTKMVTASRDLGRDWAVT